MTAYKRNQPVRVLAFAGSRLENDWSQTARIVKAADPDWYVIRFDADGARLCAHISRLMPCNR